MVNLDCHRTGKMQQFLATDVSAELRSKRQ